MSEVRFYTKSVRSMECACNTGDNLQTVLSGAERTICSKQVQGQVEALRRL